jgi:tRNA threonylcarbamoyladenosine biosynthesis protein TsaB
MKDLPENPTILALDTSTNLCSVALISGENVIEMQRDLPRAHNQHILAMVDEALGDRSLNSVDLIACGVGPGSFTGIRVAVGVAQGLGWSLDIPVLPVCSLASQAQSVSVPLGTYILSVMDAQIGQVYWAWFEVKKAGMIQLRAPSVSAPAEVVGPYGEPLEQAAPGIAILGDASDLVSNTHSALAATERIKDARPRPSQSALSFLDQIDQSLLLDAHQLEPRYVQKEISWKKLSEQGKAGKSAAKQGQGV